MAKKPTKTIDDYTKALAKAVKTYVSTRDQLDELAAEKRAAVAEIDGRIKKAQAEQAAAKEAALTLMVGDGVTSDKVLVGNVKWTVTVRAGAISVDVPDPNALPIEYQKMTVTADKKLISDALIAGKTVEGASLKRGPDTLSIAMVKPKEVK